MLARLTAALHLVKAALRIGLHQVGVEVYWLLADLLLLSEHSAREFILHSLDHHFVPVKHVEDTGVQHLRVILLKFLLEVPHELLVVAKVCVALDQKLIRVLWLQNILRRTAASKEVVIHDEGVKGYAHSLGQVVGALIRVGEVKQTNRPFRLAVKDRHQGRGVAVQTEFANFLG